MSIQGMMFTPDPCFNEPGYEGIRGTDEGDVSNRLTVSCRDQTYNHTTERHDTLIVKKDINLNMSAFNVLSLCTL